MKLARVAYKECLWDIPGEKNFLTDVAFALEWQPAERVINATDRATGLVYVIDQAGATMQPFVEPKEPAVVARPPEDRGAARSTKSRGR